VAAKEPLPSGSTKRRSSSLFQRGFARVSAVKIRRSRRGSSSARRKNSLTRWFAFPSPSGVPRQICRPIRPIVASTQDSISANLTGRSLITSLHLVFLPARRPSACVHEATRLPSRDTSHRQAVPLHHRQRPSHGD